MVNEVKFSKFIDTNQYEEAINLDDFIRRKLLAVKETDWPCF